MDGSSFSVNDNPMMHEVLSGFGAGYQFGKTPNWNGRFIYQTNGNRSNQTENGGTPGEYAGQRTADPAIGLKITGTGEHQHKWIRQNGRGAGTGSGSNVIRDKNSGANNSKTTYYTDTGQNAYDGSHEHGFKDWDSVTRPDSVCGFWIIKMDYPIG